MSFRENQATIELAFTMSFPSTPLPHVKYLRSWYTWNTVSNILDTFTEVSRYCTKKDITDADHVGKIVTSTLRKNAAAIAARDGEPLPFPDVETPDPFAPDPFARQEQEC